MRRIVILVVLAVSGVLLATAMTLGALALAGGDLGDVVHPRLSQGPAGQSPSASETPSSDDHSGTPTATPSADDHGGASEPGDDHGGGGNSGPGGSGSGGSGSGGNSGPGGGHSGDD